MWLHGLNGGGINHANSNESWKQFGCTSVRFISHLSSEVEMPSLMRIKLCPSSLSPLSSSFSKGLLKTSEYLFWLTRFYPAHAPWNLLILSQDSDSNLEKSWVWFASSIPLLVLLYLYKREKGWEGAWLGTDAGWRSCLDVWLSRATELFMFTFLR